MRQTIGAMKSKLIVFFNPKKSVIVDLLQQDTFFTAVDFVTNVILSLANRHAQQLGISAIASYICISTTPSATLIGISKNKWPAIRTSRFPTPYLPDLTIADFYLFGRLKQQLFGRTLDSDENVLETITAILSERPKNETKKASVQRKERCQ
jgi:hypothetical protein